MSNTSAYKQAIGEVVEYGTAMGWVHQGTDVCDLYETLFNMNELDEIDNLEDDIRPSFQVVWNNFSTLFAVADEYNATGEL